VLNGNRNKNCMGSKRRGAKGGAFTVGGLKKLLRQQRGHVGPEETAKNAQVRQVVGEKREISSQGGGDERLRQKNVL